MKRFVFCVVLVFLCCGVFAVEGVSPGSYEVDFEPGLEREFVFGFVLDEEEGLFVEGELSDYVELSKESIDGVEDVVVVMRLPEKLERVGASEVWIVAGDVRGLIRVNVEHPDSFVGLELSAPSVNVGEDVDVELGVLNLGVEDVSIGASVEIYRQGEGRELVDVFDLGLWRINVSGREDFEMRLNGSDYSAGDYVAVAKVDYGEGVVEEENVFRLGEFRVGILNYSKKFYGGRVNGFEIEIENLWNERIDEVYAGVRVVGTEVKFDSSIVMLEPWEKKVLTGFLDAEGIEEDVDVEISLYYGDEISREVVSLEFLKGFCWVSLVEILLVLCVAVFLLWRIRRFFNK